MAMRNLWPPVEIEIWSPTILSANSNHYNAIDFRIDLLDLNGKNLDEH